MIPTTRTFYPGRSVRIRIVYPGDRYVPCTRCAGLGWEPKLTTMDGAEACYACGGKGEFKVS